MMARAVIKLETLVSEPDTLTTRPPPYAKRGLLAKYEFCIDHKAKL